MSDSEIRRRSIERRIHKRYRSKLYPVISDSREADDMSPESFREFCDYCMQPLKPARRKGFGPSRPITFVNADNLVRRRHLAELALKFFNDHKSTSFKLVKVCKINIPCLGHYGLTFTAQEDGVKECLVFQGVVYEIRGTSKALFCEIKDDDVEITLRRDDDYVGSERALRYNISRSYVLSNKMANSGEDQSLAPNPVDSERRGRSKERHNRKRSRSKLSPVILDSREADDMSPESFCESTSFKLVNVCKINRPAPGYYGLTFAAQDDGVKECLVFRGVVYESRGTSKALFCEIKYDDV